LNLRHGAYETPALTTWATSAAARRRPTMVAAISSVNGDAPLPRTPSSPAGSDGGAGW